MEIKKGLEDVYVKETEITYIDGQLGRLYYRGYSIFDLAEFSSFEETSYLLLYGTLPTKNELEDYSNKLRKYRTIPDNLKTFLKSLPTNLNPMDVLRTSMSYLGMLERGNDPDAQIRVIASIPTIIAYYHRITDGLETVEPSEELGHAENFLYMLKGKRPTKEEANALDKALILHMDHEMNASTFAAIVVASTLSDLYSALVAGIAALKGPLHGGANYEALKMFMEVGDPNKAEEYVIERLKSGKRIMGFGHRVYRTYDPRARILKNIAREITKNTQYETLYEIAERVEQAAIKLLSGKGIFPNVDFYSGIVFYALGFRPEFFPTLFASARVVGWIAQVNEYLKENRIIRPKALYKGEVGKPYKTIDER